MRLTVGPLPPAVYWRRRALVLGAVLVLVFLIAQACMASASTGDQAGAGPSSSTSASPEATTATTPPAPPPPPATTGAPETEPDGDGGEEPEPAPRPGGADLGPEGCTDEEIRVIAEAADTSPQVGQQVQFTMRIEHAADRACRRDVGGDQRELYLVREAGAGPVWSSQDCANPTGTEVVELTDGWEPREHHIGFTGQETSKCSGPAAAGPDLAPGTYQLFARLGTALSEPVTITLK